jgi:hypothetical protein
MNEPKRISCAATKSERHRRAPTNRLGGACGLLLALSAGGLAAEDQVYKSIDADGNVTYSPTPPPVDAGVVEEVRLAPPPTEAQRQAAERRVREIEQTVAESERQRAATEEERRARIEAAEQELAEARAAAEVARVKTVDDWQTIVTGGRVLKQSYLDRVAAAEARVEAAESALQKAKQGR